MKNRNIDELIWTYLDGFATDAERKYLLERVAKDPEVESRFKLARDVNKVLQAEKSYTLSQEKKKSILHYVKSQSTTGLSKNGNNRSLWIFVLFNGLLFISALWYFSFADGSASASSSMWNQFDFSWMGDPKMQTLQIAMIGLFMLFIFDSLMKKMFQGRLTTPV